MSASVAAGDIYLLNRDAEESSRLNEQHQIATQNQGYLIHPEISSKLPPNARIADIAAGSGAWSLDVAKNFPQVQVDGYDISDKQFPTNPPANLSYSVQDAKSPFPNELRGAYDVVHVRALVAAMEHEDWARVAQNIVSLLKPGGQLQWTEADLSKLTALRDGEAAMSFTHIPRLLAAFHKQSHARTIYGASEMPAILEAAGLSDVQVDSTSSDRIVSTRSSNTRSFLIAIVSWARSSGQFDDQGLQELSAGIASEIKNGAYLRGDVFTTIGTKR